MFPITIRKCNRLPNRLNFDYVFNAASFDELKIMYVQYLKPLKLVHGTNNRV